MKRRQSPQRLWRGISHKQVLKARLTFMLISRDEVSYHRPNCLLSLNPHLQVEFKLRSTLNHPKPNFLRCLQTFSLLLVAPNL